MDRLEAMAILLAAVDTGSLSAASRQPGAVFSRPQLRAVRSGFSLPLPAVSSTPRALRALPQTVRSASACRFWCIGMEACHGSGRASGSWQLRAGVSRLNGQL